LHVSPLLSRAVKRLAKYLSIATVLVVLLLGAGGWSVNRWLQSPAGHARVEEKLTAALHRPVTIGQLSFSAWGGITAKGISVSDADGIVVDAAGLSMLSLLRGRVALNEVRIEQPHIRLFEDASGKWRLSPTSTIPPPVITEIAPPVIFQPATIAVPPPAKARAIFIGKIIVQGGAAELIDRTGAPFATITGLHITVRDVTAHSFSCEFTAGRAALPGLLSIDHLSGIANRAGDEVQIRKLTATSGGGVVTGEATWSAITNTATAALHLSAIDLTRAADEAGIIGTKIGGALSGDAQFAGLGPDKRAITGKGTLALKNGNCSQIEALRQIGEVLRLTSLANFEIADTTANFQVANEQVLFAPVEVSAPPVGLTLTGPASFDGTLNLAGLLHAPAALVERQGMVAEKFSPPDAQNRRSIPFNITGALKKPKQNLAESLTGTKDRKQQRIIAAESILSAILQRNKPKPEPPAQPPQPAPAQP
jgi:hypothetical protein